MTTRRRRARPHLRPESSVHARRCPCLSWCPHAQVVLAPRDLALNRHKPGDATLWDGPPRPRLRAALEEWGPAVLRPAPHFLRAAPVNTDARRGAGPGIVARAPLWRVGGRPPPDRPPSPPTLRVPVGVIQRAGPVRGPAPLNTALSGIRSSSLTSSAISPPVLVTVIV